MKTAKQLSITTLASLALVVAAGFAYKPAESSPINLAADMQAVTITAQRMTADQKAAFDLEEKNMQSVIVVGKAMTDAEKVAYDRANNG